MTPHTLAGFVAGFESTNGRKPEPQEIWDAAIRSWRDLSEVQAEGGAALLAKLLGRVMLEDQAEMFMGNAWHEAARDAMRAFNASKVQPKGMTLDRDDAIRIWQRHCKSFSNILGITPAPPIIDAMLAFARVAAAQAAPELLAALENLRAEAVRYLPNYNEHSAIQDADEVIVKFTGEQP